ncbi:F-box/WD repeat-containing protein 4-like Protein [Tribolium castaneum]|uniref:F-box/WD repeat-containing protein 4-like Protein n=1 Tax=Tribolium castaneum TaxID=7070 RepID=D6WCF8_TRICA|nr:PREDICTED: F-box/WD repeat-containing protein 4 [Tribolium castaneum]EEZ99019.2 F-box/WD repeat-containing protein 4-like Protein [Tribolium castaneum]|eukprot:XP_008200894.1 PREDICTED: F-box/WD repeat-containing protein 4 [Tribolium castaneum]
MVLSLDVLSTELLLKIFKYLDIPDLYRLKQTCKRFNEIIETWGHLLISNVGLLVTNQVHPVISNRSLRLLSQFERLRISKNWCSGLYDEKRLLYNKDRYFPCLQLEKDLLWFSRGAHIFAYKRTKAGIDTRNPVYTITSRDNADIFRFVKRNNLVLSGQTDGSLFLWDLNTQKFVTDLEVSQGADVNSVDLLDDILVSGSRDNFVRIWRNPFNESIIEQIDLCDRVWSVALCEEDKSLLAIGTAGVHPTPPLTIFDLNKHMTVLNFTPEISGAGVLDIRWENPSVVWSAGYDSCVRRWDLRTGNCEQVLEDPYGATVYCFQYDFFNTIVSGTHNHGRAVLWDTRRSNCVQMYFMESCRRRGRSSPVYGLSFDADFLFTVTDQHLNVLNFSVNRGKIRDYGIWFKK